MSQPIRAKSAFSTKCPHVYYNLENAPAPSKQIVLKRKEDNFSFQIQQNPFFVDMKDFYYVVPNGVFVSIFGNTNTYIPSLN